MSLRTQLIFLITVVATTGLGAAILWWHSRDRWRALARLRELSDPEADPASQGRVDNVWLGSLRRAGSFLSFDYEDRLTRLQARLIQAGIYSPQVPRPFMGLQV